MLKTIFFLGAALLSIHASADPRRTCRQEYQPNGLWQLVCYDYVYQERALQNINVQATNPGINPDFSAFIVNGAVEVAGNACMAQGLQASLDQVRRGGNLYVVARVKGWRRADRVCAMVYSPVYSQVSTTVRELSTLVANTFILNAGTLGNTVPLTSYVP